MRRYVVLAYGLTYADTVLPDTTHSVVDACRQADATVGETGARYEVVPRGDSRGEYEVFVASADLPAHLPPDVQTDLTYVATVTTNRSTVAAAGQRPMAAGQPVRTGPRNFALASSQRPTLPGAGRPSETARPAIVTASTYPALYHAADRLTAEDGGEAGVGGYVMDRRWRSSLEELESAVGDLINSDLDLFLSGPVLTRADIAARSPELTRAAEMLDEFIGR